MSEWLVLDRGGRRLALKRQAGKKVASFPGSCAGEEERQPGTHKARRRGRTRQWRRAGYSTRKEMDKGTE